MCVPTPEIRDITLGDIVLIREDLDQSVYRVEFRAQDPVTGRVDTGELELIVSGSFRPHIQASDIAFSDFEFEQYLWYRIVEHFDNYLNLSPLRISVLRLRSSDINSDSAQEFRAKKLPELPDYSVPENRKIEHWLGDSVELP